MMGMVCLHLIWHLGWRRLDAMKRPTPWTLSIKWTAFFDMYRRVLGERSSWKEKEKRKNEGVGLYLIWYLGWKWLEMLWRMLFPERCMNSLLFDVPAFFGRTIAAFFISCILHQHYKCMTASLTNGRRRRFKKMLHSICFVSFGKATTQGHICLPELCHSVSLK